MTSYCILIYDTYTVRRNRLIGLAPERDDKNWIKHSMYFANDKLLYRPVNMKPETVDAFPPVARTY